MVATGVKVFERQESKDAKGSFRICQEGLAPLLPHITKQLLEITLSEFLRLLAYRSLPIPLWPGEVDRQAAQAAEGENGAAAPVSGSCGRRGRRPGTDRAPRRSPSSAPSRRQEAENEAEALYKQPMEDPRSLAGLEGVGLGCCVVVLRRAEAEGALGPEWDFEQAPLAVPAWRGKKTLNVLVDKAGALQMLSHFPAQPGGAAAGFPTLADVKPGKKGPQQAKPAQPAEAAVAAQPAEAAVAAQPAEAAEAAEAAQPAAAAEAAADGAKAPAFEFL